MRFGCLMAGCNQAVKSRDWYVLSAIKRTEHALAATVQDMRINLGRSHIIVAEQFLYGTDVVSLFQQMGGE